MPKPEMHVFVCAQNRPAGHPRGSCGEKGCAKVAEAFFQELEKRNCFARVAITPTGCLGPCDQGPNVLVYPEGILYCQVAQEDVTTIFENHLLGGKPVERLKAPEAVWG